MDPLFNEYGERLSADICCLCSKNLRELAHEVKEGEGSMNEPGQLEVRTYAHGSPPCVCHGCERTFCVLCATEEWDGESALDWRCTECNDPAVKAKREAVEAYKAAEAAGQQRLFDNTSLSAEKGWRDEKAKAD